MTKPAYSTHVEFDFSHFVRSHGRKPRFSADACGWAFVVPEHSAQLIWTRGRKVRDLKAEVAAAVCAPVGATVYAYVQP